MATARSTSASVFAAPRLDRMEFCVRCGGNPMALSTCDGSSVPDENADPVETRPPSGVEGNQQQLGLDPIEADVRGIGHSGRPGAIHNCAWNGTQHPLLQTVADHRYPLR